MSVGILSGVGAKELVVSTLAVMYAGEDVDADSASTDTHLSQVLRQNMTPASALAYLVFILFYFPCVATITAIKMKVVVGNGLHLQPFTQQYLPT